MQTDFPGSEFNIESVTGCENAGFVAARIFKVSQLAAD